MFNIYVSLQRSSRAPPVDNDAAHSTRPEDSRLTAALEEWAAQTITRSFWAGAYYRQQPAKGSSHHIAVRALAFKWIRVLYRCWQTRTPYNEAVYLNVRETRFAPSWRAGRFGQDRVLLLYLIVASRPAARQAEGEACGEPVGNDGNKWTPIWGTLTAEDEMKRGRRSSVD